MPEGHTIHRLARDLMEDFGNQKVTCTSPQGRFLGHQALADKLFRRAHAIGKHLFLDIGRACVHIHLGLFGRFRRRREGEPPRPTTRLRIMGNGHTWDLSGPTACEIIRPKELEALKARLGADPLAEGPRPAALWTRVHASKRSMGALLLDQSLFAGIGNVYRAELLFLIGVHPDTRGVDIAKADFERLWKLAKDLLRRGVAANRIITVPGSAKRRRDQLYVYKVPACRVCKTSIAKMTSAARSIYYCPHCQALGAADRMP